MAKYTEINNDRIVWRDYDSLTDAVAHADTKPTHNKHLWDEFNSREKHETGTRWYGVKTLTEVKKAFAEGWTEGASKLERISDSVTALNPPKPLSTPVS